MQNSTALKVLSPLFLACMIVLQTFGQASKGTIKGSVRTADGKPAAFVTIALQGTPYGAVTDENGSYTFKAPGGAYTLVASVVGFEPKVQTVEIVGGGSVKVAEIVINETAQQLSEVVVVGQQASYQEKTSALATRTSAPLRDVPQTIQVINRQILQDRGVITVAEALRASAGINAFSSTQYSDYVLRGFRSSLGNFAYNGIRGDFYQFDQAAMTYNIERIEAIKGPASVLFSAGNPGGVINHVTKKAQAAPRYEAWFTLGRFDQYIGSVDATGSLSNNKKWLYRFVVGYENAGQLDQNQHIRNLFLAPQIEYRFSDRTRINYELNVSDDQRTMGFERGVPALKTGSDTWQIDRYPADFSMIDKRGYSKTRAVSNQLTLAHRFTDALRLNVWLRSVHTHQRQFDVSPGDFSTGAVNDSITMQNGFWRPDYGAYQASTFVTWDFKTGSVRNQTVAGLDYTHDGRVIQGYASLASRKVYLPAPDFSWATYDDSPEAIRQAIANDEYVAAWRERTRLAAFYFQDQITFSEKLKALIGGRVERHTYTNRYTDILTDTTTSTDTLQAWAFSPRAGLVFQPSSQVSLYASYTQGFQPQWGSNRAGGGPFPPEKSRQYEIGAKTEWFNSRLTASVAFYYIQKYDVLAPDPNDPEGQRLRQISNVTSKGVEVMLQGNVTANLSLNANYAYNEARTPGDAGYDSFGPGWFPNAPNHNANAWATYRLSEGFLKGLQAGAGFNHLGKRNTYVPGFEIPGYTVLDAMIGYTRQGFRVNLNLYNLANIRYWNGAYGPANLWPGNPRSVRLTVGYTLGK